MGKECCVRLLQVRGVLGEVHRICSNYLSHYIEGDHTFDLAQNVLVCLCCPFSLPDY